MLRGFVTRQDPKQFLFFTRTPGGIRAGKECLTRLKERAQNRDQEITVTALQAQLKALQRWGSKEPADLSKVHQPVLVANGDSDRMVPRAQQSRMSLVCWPNTFDDRDVHRDPRGAGREALSDRLESSSRGLVIRADTPHGCLRRPSRNLGTRLCAASDQRRQRRRK